MQAYRWIIDSRDEYAEERLEELSGQKLEACYQISSCSMTCPKGNYNISDLIITSFRFGSQICNLSIKAFVL